MQLGLPETHPFVSVIIPAYNAESFLPSTLASARAQTHRNLEILIGYRAGGRKNRS